MNPPSLSIVIPAYNEGARIENALDRVLACVTERKWNAEVLVVDDGSPDGTGQIADRLGAEHDWVQVLHRAEKNGIGPAYLAGFRHALDRGITLFDVADQYGSHVYLREALRCIPREKYVIQTKTHATNLADARSHLERYRLELGVEYIDIVLLHCMQKTAWPHDHEGSMEYLMKAKDEKRSGKDPDEEVDEEDEDDVTDTIVPEKKR